MDDPRRNIAALIQNLRSVVQGKVPQDVGQSKGKRGSSVLRRDFLSSVLLSASATGLRLTPAQSIKNVLDYGARPDGTTLNTRSIQRAIDEAFQAGGGTVYLPAGRFLTGRIDLKSRVILYLAADSTLLGSTSVGDYHGSPGSADSGQKHLVYARDAEEVSIAGPGRIDGQGSNFWEPSGKARLPKEDSWADVASHALKEKSSGRPSPMIRFANCRRVTVSGVCLENSAGWTLHALNCDDVEIKGIAIKNPINGPNTDGIDLTGCQNVLISDCSIETGDDAICLKSENPMGGEPRITRNIKVTKCRLSTCCNGFKLGTSSEGGFENIEFTDSLIYSNSVDLAERAISGVALEVIDGGWIDGVKVRGIKLQRTRTPIFIRLGNRKRVHDYPQHGLRNVTIDDVQASETVLASSITGLPGDEVHDVKLSNISIECVLPSRPDWIGRVVPEKESAYPEARMFGMLPSSGLYVRHARGMELDHLDFKTPAEEQRPTIQMEDVENARIDSFASSRVSGSMPVLSMSNVRNVSIANSAVPAGSGTFLGVAGSNSANITLSGDDLTGARQAFVLAADAPAGIVSVK